MTSKSAKDRFTDREGRLAAPPAGASERPLVLKFGGTALGTASRVRRAARRVRFHLRRGSRVLVVVSASGDTTDRLLRRLDAVAPGAGDAAARERDRALSTGEDLSAALLAAALIRIGVPAVSLRGGEAGLLASGKFGAGVIRHVDPERVESFLAAGVVPVVAGFQALRADGETVTIGRGGSDTTAAWLAAALGARGCHIITDVDGVYDRDPRSHAEARLLPHIRFDDLLTVVEGGGQVVHPEAASRARDAGVPLSVYAFTAPGRPARGTRVDAAGPIDVPRAPPPDGSTGPAGSPLRVALAGCGVVGGELVRLARASGAPIEFVRVLVRDTERDRDLGLPREIFTDDPADLLAAPADLVVEAIGGSDPAERIARETLSRGRRFVTANKALIASIGEDLARIGAITGGGLDFEAAVGGGVPIVRTLRSGLAGVRPRRIRGILNGTTNYILTLMERGMSFDAALSRAQANGYAEADPTRDLDGTDAADKIRILAWLAFGVWPGSLRVPTRGILPDPDRLVADARTAGAVPRVIAEVLEVDGRVTASVQPIFVAPGSEFGRASGESNCIAIDYGWNSPVVLSGPGAGGSPTAAALLSDILSPGPAAAPTACGRGSEPVLPAAPRSVPVLLDRSIHGHDAPLEEPAALAPVLPTTLRP